MKRNEFEVEYPQGGWDMNNNDLALQSLEEAKSRLVNGVCVVIFPEGTRSVSGEVAVRL